MIDREFTEVDLRHMLQQATDLPEDVVDGRWFVETWHLEHSVEPDVEPQRLVVITAYPMW